MKAFKPINRLAYFSRWTRKSYAAFASLDRVIKISFLSTTLTLLALPQKSEAQKYIIHEQDTTHQLEEVEVIGDPTPQILSEMSRIITVVMPSQISHAPVNSINDILKNLAAIDLRQRGPNDVQADISMRGGNFDQVMVMLNGVNINNPQTGHHNLDLPISLSQIEKIEIISGSASRIYGPDAFSGAVNIITKKPSKPMIELEALVGDFGLFSSTASTAITNNKSGHLISISRTSSNGYMENTDFKKTTIFYSASIKFKSAELNFQSAFADKGYGAQSFYTPKYPHQYEKTKSGFGSLTLKTKGFINTLTTAYFKGHTDRFELFRDNLHAPPWYHNHNYHFSKITGLNFRAFSYQKNGKSTLGTNLRYENIHSNVLGIPMGDTIAAFMDSDGYYTRFDSRMDISAFGEQVLIWDKFRLAGGFLLNHFQNDSVFLRLYPGIDASYTFSPTLKIMGSANRALRRPTFTDLYYQGPSNIGNPDLLPETALSYEVSLIWKTKGIRTSISGFLTNGKNTIDWVRLSDTLKWQPKNIAATKTYGVEWNAVFSMNDIFKNQHFVQTINIMLATHKVERSTGIYLSHYVDDYLKMKLNISATHQFSHGLSVSWNYSYIHRNGQFLAYDSSTGKGTPTDFGAHSTLDIKLMYKNKNWEVFTNVINVFSAKYYDYGNIPAPGRWISLGLKWKMDWS